MTNATDNALRAINLCLDDRASAAEACRIHSVSKTTFYRALNEDDDLRSKFAARKLNKVIAGAHCPKCGEKALRVVEQHMSKDKAVIYRTRECGKCSNWLSTEERLENHGRNVHEDRLVDIYRKMKAQKRKALWNLLKLI